MQRKGNGKLLSKYKTVIMKERTETDMGSMKFKTPKPESFKITKLLSPELHEYNFSTLSQTFKIVCAVN